MYSFLLFLLGLVLLIAGSSGVIKNALIISRLTRVSPLVIGITMVAIGTSLPEIVVSFFGGLEKASDLSFGNIIGSNIANIGFILGVSLLLKPIYIGKTKTQKNMLITLLVSLFLFVSLLVGGLSFIHGFVFIVLGFTFITWLVTQGKKEDIPEELSTSKIITSPISAVGIFIISITALIFGGKILVDTGIALANLFNIPEAIVGITAIAIGTSLPELAVSVIGLTKNLTRHEEKLIIGNILGSNIFNILFGAGTLGLFGAKHFNSTLSLYVFMIFTLVLCFLIYFFKGKTIPRYFGIVLLGLYIAYLLLLPVFYERSQPLRVDLGIYQIPPVAF